MPLESEPKQKPPTITQVAYGMTVNVGNYEAVRFDLTASVGPDEDWRTVMAGLRARAEKLRDRARAESS